MSSASFCRPAEAVSEDLYRSPAFSDADAGLGRCSCSSMEIACVRDHSSPMLANVTSKGTNYSLNRNSLMSTGMTSCTLSAEGDPEGVSANCPFFTFSLFHLLDFSTRIASAPDGFAGWSGILDRLSMLSAVEGVVDFRYF